MGLLKTREVSSKLGMTRNAFHCLRRREDSFPNPIKVSKKTFRWEESDIDLWLAAKKERLNGENSRVE